MGPAIEYLRDELERAKADVARLEEERRQRDVEIGTLREQLRRADERNVVMRAERGRFR